VVVGPPSPYFEPNQKQLAAHLLPLKNPSRGKLIANRVVATGELQEELVSSDTVWKVVFLGQLIAAAFSRNNEVILEVRSS
jgi:hypothetical protein